MFELQRMLGEPPIKATGETFEEYLRRGSSLPVRENGPLMQFELGEIRSMLECELNALIDWLQVSRLMLASIEADPRTIRELIWRGESIDFCPDVVSDKKSIPYATVGGIRDLGPTPQYSFDKEFFGGRYAYWIPVEYLP